jgi:hypothetical protein
MFKRIWMVITFLAIASLMVAACGPAEEACSPYADSSRRAASRRPRVATRTY